MDSDVFPHALTAHGVHRRSAVCGNYLERVNTRLEHIEIRRREYYDRAARVNAVQAAVKRILILALNVVCVQLARSNYLRALACSLRCIDPVKERGRCCDGRLERGALGIGEIIGTEQSLGIRDDSLYAFAVAALNGLGRICARTLGNIVKLCKDIVLPAISVAVILCT